MSRNAKNLRENLLKQVKTSPLGKDVFRRIMDYAQQNQISIKDEYNVFSLAPSVVTEADYQAAAELAVLTRRALNRLLETFRREGQQKRGILHRYFSPYERFFSLVQTERRSLDEICFMRIDLAPPHGKRSWLAFEPNTACPGGPVFNPTLTNLWLAEAVKRKIVNPDHFFVSPLMGDVKLFIKFLDKIAQKIARAPVANIMVGNFKGIYTLELAAMRIMHDLLKKQGLVKGEIFVDDIRQLEAHGDRITYKGKDVHLIYNKLDPLMVEENDPEIQAWIAASRSSRCEFLNSFGAFFLTETKRVFGALRDEKILVHIGMEPEERKILRRFIPITEPLDLIDKKTWKNFLTHPKQWVLKPDALTRGMGIKIGAECKSKDWVASLKSVPPADYVIQEYIQLPEYKTLSFDSFTKEIVETKTYYGLDMFLFADDPVGLVGRCHNQKIINVGAGGKFTPCLVLRG